VHGDNTELCLRRTVWVESNILSNHNFYFDTAASPERALRPLISRLRPFQSMRIPLKPSNNSDASRSPIPIDAEQYGSSAALGAIF
jgi:hypothetical protein